MDNYISRSKAEQITGLTAFQIGRLVDLRLIRTHEDGRGLHELDVLQLPSRINEAALYLAKTRETTAAPGPVEKLTVH